MLAVMLEQADGEKLPSLDALDFIEEEIDILYGNIRELNNAADRVCAAYRGPLIDRAVLEPALFPPDLEEYDGGFPPPVPEETAVTARGAEAARLRAVLEQCGYRKDEAAKVLGIHRTTLWRKMKRYGLEKG